MRLVRKNLNNPRLNAPSLWRRFKPVYLGALPLAALLWTAQSAPALAHTETAENQVEPAQDDCRMPDGWKGIAALAPRFVVFGESHGTAQAPALVGDVICSLAARGKSVLLAVEFTSHHDSALQDAWNAPVSEFAQALEQGGFERRRDGVGSAAMLRLLERAHLLKSQGAMIDITAFNGARDEEQSARFANLPGQGPHEAAQAENIAHAADNGEYDIVIVLVGNLHAEKTAITMGGITFEPMAAKLGQYGAVVSLDHTDAGGTSWNCQTRDDFEFVPGQPIPRDAIVCADYPTNGSRDLGREPFMALGAFPGREMRSSYDGYFWLGPITASPPAFED